MILEATSAWGEAWVRWTIRLALVLYALALLSRWSSQPALRVWTRLLWTSSWGLYLLHVFAAFHVYHHWSHNHAYAHTQAVSGWGPGIYVSYAFTILWGLTVLGMWLPITKPWPGQRWLMALIHGLLFFVIFNGAVVFAEGPVRWLSLAVCVGLVGVLLFHWRKNNRGCQHASQQNGYAE